MIIDLKQLHSALSDEIEAAVMRVLRSGWYILGTEVAQFEEAFAAYHGVKHAIAVANGTDAIELAMLAHNIGAGHEVITVAHTAMPTVTAIEQVGATPVLVDILPDTYLIDPDAIEAAITPKTRAIIPVHLYGHPVQIDRIKAIADEHNLLLLEDCAQAHGATFDGQKIGTFGDIASFSFYPTKNLGTYGDAGAIITDDDAIATRLRQLRNYGQDRRYHNVERGVNSRMDDIQAAILRVKLQYLDDHNNIRRSLAQKYNEALQHVVLPIEQANAHHVYHLYVVRTPRRDALRDFLAERGIQTGIHYPIPIHRQPSQTDLGYSAGSLPITEQSAEKIVSLPMHVHLTADEQQHVIDSINAFGELQHD
ncbi:MAG: DegT/DnrJ/EryC1/StrS family aminotransferase [Chloroflexota bacterium]